MLLFGQVTLIAAKTEINIFLKLFQMEHLGGDGDLCIRQGLTEAIFFTVGQNQL